MIMLLEKQMHQKAKMTDLLITLRTLCMHAAGMTVEIMHAVYIPYSSLLAVCSFSNFLASLVFFLFCFVTDI